MNCLLAAYRRDCANDPYSGERGTGVLFWSSFIEPNSNLVDNGLSLSPSLSLFFFLSLSLSPSLTFSFSLSLLSLLLALSLSFRENHGAGRGRGGGGGYRRKKWRRSKASRAHGRCLVLDTSIPGGNLNLITLLFPHLTHVNAQGKKIPHPLLSSLDKHRRSGPRRESLSPGKERGRGKLLAVSTFHCPPSSHCKCVRARPRPVISLESRKTKVMTEVISVLLPRSETLF